ncbi:hypothetical protein GGR51DRAFT_539889 [Nemania sp. FL0031]|nr:hypothetical protein GGR51DRAFT_539889 [Nemania sp. FL0031]
MADYTGEHETHVLKDPETLKPPSKTLACLSRCIDASDLTGREFRKHAGEVRQRNDRNIRAEAPPQPAQARTINRAKPGHGRKKRAEGLGDDDGSDSERENSQRGFGEIDGGVGVRKKNARMAEPKHNVAGPSTQILLTLEEEERMELQRRITREEEDWMTLLRVRLINRYYAEKEMKQMLRVLQAEPETLELLWNGPETKAPEKRWPTPQVFAMQNQRMSHYLDEALCHDIGDMNEEGTSGYISKQMSRLELLEEIIKLAEREFCIWWEQFVTPPEPTVQSVVKQLLTTHAWIREFMGQPRDCLLRSFKLHRFSAWYHYRIMTQFGLQSVLDRPGQFSKFNQAVDRSVDIMEMLSNSREKNSLNERLNEEYINWVCDDAPPDLIDTCCQRRLQQIRGSEIRQMMGPASITQEFCQDSSGRTLSLILFKYRIPFSIKPVQSLERKCMGWYHTTDEKMEGNNVPKYGLPCESVERFSEDESTREQTIVHRSRFYRYEFDNSSGHYFKLGINGEFLGLCTPRAYVYWEENYEGYNDDDGDDNDSSL